MRGASFGWPRGADVCAYAARRIKTRSHLRKPRRRVPGTGFTLSGSYIREAHTPHRCNNYNASQADVNEWVEAKIAPVEYQAEGR